jgi:23S rRNA (guanine2445-N2)-methyltransferase / 23S rRNA (guanine2069-N7)-methyltransferase
VVVQEYAPPKTVDAHKARQRLFDIIAATIAVLGIAPNKLVLKTRERQKGKNQYQKMGEKGDFIEVQEYNASVGKPDRLSGYRAVPRPPYCSSHAGPDEQRQRFPQPFLLYRQRQRPCRPWRRAFHDHGDMSRTYLEWAERNLRLNGLTGRAHRLMQADVLGWLRDRRTVRSDLYRSANLLQLQAHGRCFDVQRDHLRLMTDLKRLLRKGGTIMFSNNKRGFRMDHDGLAQLGLKAQEISQKTLSQDFARNRQIHNCWLITAA